MNNTNQKGFVTEKKTLSLEQLVELVKAGPKFGQAGDIITFTGVVRETSMVSNKKVTAIEIEAYEEPAVRELNQICEELIERYDLVDARVVHFKGSFSVGEILVHCAIASKHRQEGFAAIEAMIEEYKHRAYIFKREIYADGTSEWISENKPT